MLSNFKLFVVFFVLILSVGCANTNKNVLSENENGSVKIRNIQTRSFETSDKNIVTRNVISTLQDLGFVIDSADADLGTVSATKLSGYKIKMTVTVRSNKQESIVRANARYNNSVILDPMMYQDFFGLLSKSLFLDANNVV